MSGVTGAAGIAVGVSPRALGSGDHGVVVLGQDGALRGLLASPGLPGVLASSVATLAGSRDYLRVVGADGQARCLGSNGPVPSSKLKYDALGVGEVGSSCGLLQGGSVRCWGGSFLSWTYWTDSAPNALDGALVQIPEKVSSLASGGELHMCALAVSGRVWCWAIARSRSASRAIRRSAPASTRTPGAP